MWCYIDDDHLIDRRWPLVCRLYNVPLKDEVAFQHHLANEYVLSRIRPIKPALSAALDSQNEKMPLDKEALGANLNYKCKSSSDTRTLG